MSHDGTYSDEYKKTNEAEMSGILDAFANIQGGLTRGLRVAGKNNRKINRARRVQVISLKSTDGKLNGRKKFIRHCI